MRENRIGHTSAIRADFDRLKAMYPGHLAIFEVGPFHELYAEDALTAGRLLGVEMRYRFRESADPILTAFIRNSELQSALLVLLQHGESVAICGREIEQGRLNGGAA